ncbi:MAG: RICIN domain-containing protein [Lachnospiraceae bacterium]|nr:RICIN domain-containing protein [Lachnospiraceae bacterium]
MRYKGFKAGALALAMIMMVGLTPAGVLGAGPAEADTAQDGTTQVGIAQTGTTQTAEPLMRISDGSGRDLTGSETPDRTAASGNDGDGKAPSGKEDMTGGENTDGSGVDSAAGIGGESTDSTGGGNTDGAGVDSIDGSAGESTDGTKGDNTDGSSGETTDGSDGDDPVVGDTSDKDIADNVKPDDKDNEASDSDLVIMEDEDLPFGMLGEDSELKEGYYRIESALNADYVMDVAGGSTEKRANIQLYINNGTPAQVFYVKPIGNGRYTIQNFKSSYYLNVQNGSIAKGANIWQYKNDGTYAMQFYIAKGLRDGCSIIRSVKSGFVCDVENGKAAKRTNIRLWRMNYSAAQEWRFVPVSGETEAKMNNGYYTLVSKANGKVMDVADASLSAGANVKTHKSNGTAAQVFYLEKGTDGTYSLMACNSGLYLSFNGTANAGTNVVQREWSESDKNQKWRIYDTGGGLKLVPASDVGKTLRVNTGADGSGVNVELAGTTSADPALWTFKSVSEPSVALATGVYEIYPTGQSRYAFDVENASVGTANVRIHKANHTEAQKFLVMPDGKGGSLIINMHSFNALDVAGASSAEGTNVQQHTANNKSLAQNWKIVGCQGRYRIVSSLGSRVLSVSGSIGQDANLVIASDKGAAGQRFCFRPVISGSQPVDGKIYRIVSALDPTKVIDVPNSSWAEGMLMQIHSSNFSENQNFRLTSTGDGYYLIMNAKNGLVLTAKAYGGSTWGASSGTTVIDYNEIEGNSYKIYQKWQLVPTGDGGYYIKNAACGYYIDVKGGLTAEDTPLQVYKFNGSQAQKFYFNRTSTSCYLRWHGYAADSTGKMHWLEGTFWDDPRVSDQDFLAAAIYTEAGNQGLAGMMMVGYSILNTTSLQDVRFAIYDYGQYEICRNGSLTKILNAISTNNTAGYNSLGTARNAGAACAGGQSVTLEEQAVMTYPGGTTVYQKGAVLNRSVFARYDGFMTPAAWQRHGFTTAGHHTLTYKGHIYYNEAEIWK